MSGLRPHLRTGVLVALSVAALGLGGCDAITDLLGGGRAATLASAEGEVTVRREGVADPLAGDEGLGLVLEDVVSTGPASTARIEFEGGNAVTLNENSSLVIRAEGGVAVGAVLLEGTASAESAGSGVVIAIGTPFGVTEIGAVAVKLEIAEKGLQVLVGQIMVDLDDGQKIIKQGDMMTVDGLVVPIGTRLDGLEVVLEEKEEDFLELDPVVINLLADNKRVQIKRKDEDKWKAPKKVDALSTGDSLRTRNAKRTNVQLGESSELVLPPNAEVQLGEVGTKGSKHRATYRLDSGAARIRINEKLDEIHKVEAGGSFLKVRPGAERADVALANGRSGRVKVDVRLGKVQLEDGTIIEAGSSATVKDGKLDGKITPIARASVALRPRGSSEIFYQGSVPPLGFDWKGAKKGGNDPAYGIQVSKDRDFKTLVFSEEIRRSDFVFEGFTEGRYYWRVKDGEGFSKGTFKISKHKEKECTGCKRKNHINHGGERDVIYYQQKLPSIVFHWKAVPGAKEYRVQVFADGEFDAPLVAQSSPKNLLELGEGKLREGKYFWVVKALDASNKEVAIGGGGGMNTLLIEYDNAIVDLRISSPRHKERTSKSRVYATGEVQLGAKLMIDGKSVSPNAQGRFRHPVRLSKGTNRVVFRSLAKDGIERYYIREVYRR